MVRISYELPNWLGPPDLEFLKVCKVKNRKASYKGRGRPKKEDIVYIPFEQYKEYMAMEALENGFTTHFTSHD